MESLWVGLSIAAVASVIAALIGWIVWVVNRHGRERLRGQLDLQRRMLEKFGSATEFVTFAGTESGRRFLENLSTEHGVHAQSIMGSIRKGAVLSLLGAGLCTLPFIKPEYEPAAIFGVVALTTGIGFLISAWASYRLSRSWGLLPPSA
jgi:hypothetical protein